MRETAVSVYTIHDYVPNYRQDRSQQTFDNNKESKYQHARFIEENIDWRFLMAPPTRGPLMGDGKLTCIL